MMRRSSGGGFSSSAVSVGSVVSLFFMTQWCWAVEIKVATYNIRCASKWALQDGGDRAARRGWAERRDRVARQIAISGAAIVGTQEGLAFQLDDLLTLLAGDWRRVGAGRTGAGDDSDELAAILYDASRVALTATGDFWLSEAPETPGSKAWGAALPRVATWASFNASSRSFSVLNTHFDHASAKARLKSANLVRRRAFDLFHTSVAFITADFNGDKAQPWHAELTRDGAFVDAWEAAAERFCGACGASTFHGWRGSQPSSRDQALSLSGVKHIDGVYTKRTALDAGALVAVRMLTDDRRRQTYGGPFASDHYPVVATFRFHDDDSHAVGEL